MGSKSNRFFLSRASFFKLHSSHFPEPGCNLRAAPRASGILKKWTPLNGSPTQSLHLFSKGFQRVAFPRFKGCFRWGSDPGSGARRTFVLGELIWQHLVDF